MKHSDLTTLFNRFVGKEIVTMTEMMNTIVPDVLNDPTLSAMADIANANGSQYFWVWTPEMEGLPMPKSRSGTNMVHVYLEKDADGKHRVSDKFKLS